LGGVRSLTFGANQNFNYIAVAQALTRPQPSWRRWTCGSASPAGPSAPSVPSPAPASPTRSMSSRSGCRRPQRQRRPCRALCGACWPPTARRDSTAGSPPACSRRSSPVVSSRPHIAVKFTPGLCQKLSKVRSRTRTGPMFLAAEACTQACELAFAMERTPAVFMGSLG